MNSPDETKQTQVADDSIVAAYGVTDQGKVRKNNEDAFVIVPEAGLFIVSDGMGGHSAGEVASAMVVKLLPPKISKVLQSTAVENNKTLIKAVSQEIKDISKLVHQKATEEEGLRGMGATLAACLIYKKSVIIANMGDSRIYRLRNGSLEQVTQDHTLPNMLLKMGKITKEEFAVHPDHNVLTNVVGAENGQNIPELTSMEAQKGDRFLLCSDGLTNMVNDEKIKEILINEGDIRNACAKLIQSANDAGGKDNITALIVQYG